MATTSSSSAIQFNGAISGLDTASIISALLTAEKAPLTAIATKRTTLLAQQTAYATLRTQLATLQAATKALYTGGSAAARAATSSNTGVLAATAVSGAVAGSYQVTVNTLATMSRMTSQGSIGTAITNDPADLAKTLSSLNLPGSVTAGTMSMVVDNTIVSATIGSPDTATLGDTINAMASAIQAQVRTTDASATVTAQITSNRLEFVVSGASSSHTVSFGVSGDTSNAAAMFGLSSISKATLSNSTSVTGKSALGTVKTTSALDAAGMSGLTSTTSGVLTINGAAISYDTTVDSLSSIISKINASTAGVTASIDRANDQLVLTAKAGGASPIAIADTSGTLAAALKLEPGSTANQSLGAQASVTVDGTTYLSNSNTVSTAISGVRLSLAALGTSTVTVTADTTTMTKAVQSVVDAYNSLADSLDTLTANTVNGTKGALVGNSSVRGIALSFRSILTGISSSSTVLTNLSDIGVTTGKYGSAATATRRLVFDSTTLASALETNSSAVSDLLTGVMGTLTSSIDTWTKLNGTLDTANAGILAQLAALTKQEDQVNARVEARQAALEAKYAALEATLAKMQTTTNSLTNTIAQQNKSG